MRQCFLPKVKGSPGAMADISSVDRSIKLEAVFDRFEKQCQRGVPDSLESYLDQVPRENRGRALRELLLLSLFYRSGVDTPRCISAETALDSKFSSEKESVADHLKTPMRLLSVDAERQHEPAHFRCISDRFRLLRRLGEGGFGTVYKAFDQLLHREVAIKLPRFAAVGDEESANRWLAEAVGAARLCHPNIVPVYEAGALGDTYYVVSPFISGTTLRRVLQDQKVATVDACKVMIAISNALAYAHNKGVVHRDVKPENILIDNNGKPMITDFGLALQADSDTNSKRKGTQIGTVPYMSPEQKSSSDTEMIDGRADIWSLGIVLHELITGRRPSFQNDLICSDGGNARPPGCEFFENAPKGLREIGIKCLQANPDDRYCTGQELADDLNRWLQSTTRSRLSHLLFQLSQELRSALQRLGRLFRRKL